MEERERKRAERVNRGNRYCRRGEKEEVCSSLSQGKSWT